MSQGFDAILDRYDRGQLSRRELLGALVLAGLPASHAASPPPTVGAARHVNHATLFVRNVERSRAFYQRLFGMPVLTTQDGGVNLKVGEGFIGLYESDPAEQPRIDHVCLALDDFDADRVKGQLAREGIEAAIRLRGETKELYFTDPDGIRIQLQHSRYRGGGGPLGDRATR